MYWLPGSPSPPPQQPQGDHSRRPPSSETVMRCRNSSSRTAPSPPRQRPMPPDRCRRPNRQSLTGNRDSSTSGSVSLELVMCGCTALAPSNPKPVPTPPQMVSQYCTWSSPNERLFIVPWLLASLPSAISSASTTNWLVSTFPPRVRCDHHMLHSERFTINRRWPKPEFMFVKRSRLFEVVHDQRCMIDPQCLGHDSSIFRSNFAIFYGAALTVYLFTNASFTVTPRPGFVGARNRPPTGASMSGTSSCNMGLAPSAYSRIRAAGLANATCNPAQCEGIHTNKPRR